MTRIADGTAVDPSGQLYRPVGAQRCRWESHFQIIPFSRADPLRAFILSHLAHQSSSCLLSLFSFTKRIHMKSRTHQNYGQVELVASKNAQLLF